MTRFCQMTRVSVVLMFVVVLSVGAAFGQQVTGTILGRVTDSTGAVVPGASVQIQNPATGFSRTETADADGRYLESNLSLGTYTVTVQKQGFQTLIRSGIVLSVGSEVAVNAELVVGDVQQHVEVTGEAPQIETTNATVSGLVSPEQMRSLPLNGRSIEALALLSPGVISYNYAGPPSGTGSLGSGMKISVDGQRRDATLFLLDGTTVNDQQNGGPASVAGVALGIEGILEFRVLTHDYSAEYGRKAGAVVSEVTRSGTNQLHGSVYEFVRNNYFDARTWNNPGALPPFRRNQFGAAAGGPIIKDKLFFFVNYEGLRQRLGTSTTVFVPGQAIRGTAALAVQPYLALWPLPNPGSTILSDGSGKFVYTASQAIREDYSMMRLDYKISDKDNFYLRYVFDPANQTTPGDEPGFVSNGFTTNHFVVLSETHVFSQSSLNDFHFAFNRSVPNSQSLYPSPSSFGGIEWVPGQGLGGLQFGAAAVSGGGSSTISAVGPGQTGCCFLGAQNIFQETDTFSKVMGAHSLKVGVDVERQQLNIYSATSVAGFYAFPDFASFLTASPSRFTVLLPNGIDSAFRGWRRIDFGVFVQDDWRVSSRLSLNLGVREEFMTSPTEASGRAAQLLSPFTASLATAVNSPFQTRKDNISPRVGLAWDPTGSGKTSVRMGGGIFYGFLDGRTWYFPAERNSIFSDSVSVNNPLFPNGVTSAFSGGGVPTTYTMLPRPHEPTTIQYNMDIQRQLAHGISVEAGYVGSVGYHMPWLVEENTRIPTGFSSPTQPIFPASGGAQVNPKFADIFLLADNGRYSYNGLQAVMRKSLSAGFQFQASYSFGRAMSNSDEYTNGEITSNAPTMLNLWNPNQDWSRSVFDQKHRFTFNASYEIPFGNNLSNGVAKRVLGGWALNGIVTAASGLPIDVLSGTNRSNNGDSFDTDRPNLNTAAGFTGIPNSGTTGPATLPATAAFPQGQACLGVGANEKLGTATLWFNPCAVSTQTVGTFGNLERNALIGPKLINTDAALVKNTVLTERFKLEFRAEFFNLFNKAQLGLPVTNLFASSGSRQSNAGNITTAAGPNRQLQLGLKLTF